MLAPSPGSRSYTCDNDDGPSLLVVDHDQADAQQDGGDNSDEEDADNISLQPVAQQHSIMGGVMRRIEMLPALDCHQRCRTGSRGSQSSRSSVGSRTSRSRASSSGSLSARSERSGRSGPRSPRVGLEAAAAVREGLAQGPRSQSHHSAKNPPRSATGRRSLWDPMPYKSGTSYFGKTGTAGSNTSSFDLPFRWIVMLAIWAAILSVCFLFVPVILQCLNFATGMTELLGSSVDDLYEVITTLKMENVKKEMLEALYTVTDGIKIEFAAAGFVLDGAWRDLQMLSLAGIVVENHWTGHQWFWYHTFTSLKYPDSTLGTFEPLHSHMSQLLQDGLGEELEDCTPGRYGAPKSVFVGWASGALVGMKANCSGFFAWSAPPVFSGVSSSLSTWIIDNATGRPTTPQDRPVTVEPYDTTQRPWFTVQSGMVGTDSEVSTYATPVYRYFDGPLGISLTLPLSPCGYYSCFEGSVGVDLTLAFAHKVLLDVRRDWEALLEGPRYKSNLDDAIKIFIVSNRYPGQYDQDGILIGTSTHDLNDPGQSDEIMFALNSTIPSVSITAKAILWKYSDWDFVGDAADRSNQTGLCCGPGEIFSFKILDEEQPSFSECPAGPEGSYLHQGCSVVGVKTVAVDPVTSWIVVLVMPVDALSERSSESALDIYRAAKGSYKQMRDFQHKLVWIMTGTLVAAAFMVAPCMGACLSHYVARPLRKLSRLMHRLSLLDFSNKAPEFEQLSSGRRSHVREIAELQSECAQLAKGVEVFARFVPETVVRNILRGDKHAQTLHVEHRNVTIMFSDIRGFTTIAEGQTPANLIFLLTLYLSTMTEVIQSCEGVVAEVLGDGILAYWNTPDTVASHPAKACGAAMAQHRALDGLNRHFAQQELPQISIGIGLHTGDVLSGNIGSKSKMKFGCIGDSVNLASRLEGLCKLYGVSTICSGATCAELPPPGQKGCFLVRKLDVVQVKGKQSPTELFEVVAASSSARNSRSATAASFGQLTPPSAPDRRRQASATAGAAAIADADVMFPSAIHDRIRRAKLYEAALAAYHAARFDEACRLAEELLRQGGDPAAVLLLERSRRYVSHDGRPPERMLSEGELASWTGVYRLDEK